MTAVYELRKKTALWGDYGDMLLHGMTDGATYHGDDTIGVTRVGPFVPPISQPFGEALVTTDLRDTIAARFPAIRFDSAPYKKVTHIDWRTWDLSARDPAELPAGGAPENYIERRKHDADLTARMPSLFVIKAAPTPGLQQEGSRKLIRDRVPAADVFRTYTLLFVSEPLAELLQSEAGEWVECVPAEFADP